MELLNLLEANFWGMEGILEQDQGALLSVVDPPIDQTDQFRAEPVLVKGRRMYMVYMCYGVYAYICEFLPYARFC